MSRFLGIITCLGLLIFLAGFVSLFSKELGFSDFMTTENWSKFQELTISMGMLISLIAGTLSYIFFRKS